MRWALLSVVCRCGALWPSVGMEPGSSIFRLARCGLTPSSYGCGGAPFSLRGETCRALRWVDSRRWSARLLFFPVTRQHRRRRPGPVLCDRLVSTFSCGLPGYGQSRCFSVGGRLYRTLIAIPGRDAAAFAPEDRPFWRVPRLRVAPLALDRPPRRRARTPFLSLLRWRRAITRSCRSSGARATTRGEDPRSLVLPSVPGRGRAKSSLPSSRQSFDLAKDRSPLRHHPAQANDTTDGGEAYLGLGEVSGGLGLRKTQSPSRLYSRAPAAARRAQRST